VVGKVIERRVEIVRDRKNDVLPTPEQRLGPLEPGLAIYTFAMDGRVYGPLSQR
jgi:hypothetical protein